MPSKSKAQARMFAAAAHDPKFAKKVGIDSKTAKEWNSADEDKGTLKNGSKVPEKVEESEMRSWIDLVDYDRYNAAEDPEEQEDLLEMPMKFDAFKSAGSTSQEYIDRTDKIVGNDLTVLSDDGNIKIARNKSGDTYMAIGQNGQKVAAVEGIPTGNVFQEDVIAGSEKGAVYKIYMQILKDGFSILSDQYHSDGAMYLWQKLIKNHTVYIVGDGEVIAKATPEKFHKYWGDANSPSRELKLLLVK